MKMTIVPKAIYRIHVTPIELPRTIFTELEQNILVSMKTQKTTKKHSNLGGESGRNKGRRIILPDFRLYYKAPIIKKCGTGTKTGI